MDPNTALDLMREAQSAARWEDAETHAADLGLWLFSGGFHPDGLTARELDYCLRASRSVAA